MCCYNIFPIRSVTFEHFFQILQQQPKNHLHLPAFSASSSSPAVRFNRGVNFQSPPPHHNLSTNVIVNPNSNTVIAVSEEVEESGESEPKSWMPLLVSSRQQESDL